jgi:phosphoribosylformimino-5-aminoimidazole carboxamide ribotide isomerase
MDKSGSPQSATSVQTTSIPPMHIVPVFDLMDGVVVRGIAGRRREYRPIDSPLCPDSQPTTLAGAFAELNLAEAYVADLDAIEGREPNCESYRTLFASGMRLWIDAGLRDARGAAALAGFDHRVTGVIAGLETVPDSNELAAMIATVGSERLIFSLDLKAGQPLTASPAWAGMSAEEIGARALDRGVRRIIVLDLAQVGTGAGVGTEALCRQLRAQDPHMEIIAGGGVRGVDDLRALAAAGCNAALVASALHDGRIGRAEIEATANW